MNVKIERVIREIEKTKGKINEFQAKLRDLEKQKTELENLEIIGAIRGMDISIADLATLFNKENIASDKLVPKPKASKKEIIKEDDNETDS